MIDLRSDTCSRPTEPMREAMANAEVGDDVFGDDPTVRTLERRVAEVLGKEDAIYMPTGTMTNQVALRAYTEPGDEVIMGAGAHLSLLESGAPASLSGLTIRHLDGEHGVYSADEVNAAIRPQHHFMPNKLFSPTKLLCVENTHNVAGGTVWPVETVFAVTEAARNHGLATHLDGARLWHASVKTGVSEAEYAAPFDSVSVCFSKGLGAPVGSVLAAGAEFISRARRFKQMFGGGFRQAGIIAAGALYGLENYRERLVNDHENAAMFAEALEPVPGIELDRENVHTNIVRFRVSAMAAAEFVERCHNAGVYMLPSGFDQVRAVFYLNISRKDAQNALDVIQQVLMRDAA